MVQTVPGCCPKLMTRPKNIHPFAAGAKLQQLTNWHRLWQIPIIFHLLMLAISTAPAARVSQQKHIVGNNDSLSDLGKCIPRSWLEMNGSGF